MVITSGPLRMWPHLTLDYTECLSFGVHLFFHSRLLQHDLGVLGARFPWWVWAWHVRNSSIFMERLSCHSKSMHLKAYVGVEWLRNTQGDEGPRSIIDLGFNLSSLFALPPRAPPPSKTYLLFFTSRLLSPQVSPLLLPSLREVWGWEASRNSGAVAMNIPPHILPPLSSRISNRISFSGSPEYIHHHRP